MAITLNLYDRFRELLVSGNALNFDAPGGNGIKVAFVTNSYTPNQNTHDFFDDVSANQVSGSNYTAGGNACASPSATMNGAGLITIDMDDPAQWVQHAAGFANARYVIVYHDTGTGSTSKLIGYANNGADFGNVAGPVDVQINAAGLMTLPR